MASGYRGFDDCYHHHCACGDSQIEGLGVFYLIGRVRGLVSSHLISTRQLFGMIS